MLRKLTGCGQDIAYTMIQVVFRQIDVAETATGKELPDQRLPMPTNYEEFPVHDHIPNLAPREQTSPVEYRARYTLP
jgi:hypothetical protein